MPIELKMPALSPTMEKGTVARWLVAVGDKVIPGDLLAEIETDKATMELEAVDEGHVAALIVPDGSIDVPVGAVIALLAGLGDATADTQASATQIGDKVVTPAVVSPPEAAAPPTPSPVEMVTASPITLDQNANATPLARRIAATKGIALAGVSGSGPRGKIVKADLGLPPVAGPQAMPPGSVASSLLVAPGPSFAPPEGVPVETVRLSGMRKTIARRLTQSKQAVPHFYLTARCRLDAVLALRRELNDSLEAQRVKLSVNDMLIKAMALALREVPDANVQFGGDELHRFARVDISMAVAIEGGLVTPIIRDAGSLSLSAIARSSKALAAKARDGKLVPEDYEGGTASISNLGMFGIDEMLPVINPPQSLILGIGAGIEQPWKVGGSIGLATIMAVTGSFDHRAIDGAIGAQFMSAFRDLVEMPMRILA